MANINKNIPLIISNFAKDELGYSQAALDAFAEAGSHDLQPGAESGRFYSQYWAKVSPSYTGKQYMYMYGAKTPKE